MNFSDYVKNKDLQITNDDIDINKLTSDLRKGYISEDDVNSKIEDAKTKWDVKTTKDYTDLENKYNDIVKDLGTANETIKSKNMQVEMVKNHFDESQFDEISKLRYSLYADEKDDSKAIKNIAEKFKGTYFKNTDKNQNQNNNQNYDNNYLNNNGEINKKDIKITRNTSISSLIKKN